MYILRSYGGETRIEQPVLYASSYSNGFVCEPYDVEDHESESEEDAELGQWYGETYEEQMPEWDVNQAPNSNTIQTGETVNDIDYTYRYESKRPRYTVYSAQFNHELSASGNIVIKIGREHPNFDKAIDPQRKVYLYDTESDLQANSPVWGGILHDVKYDDFKNATITYVGELDYLKKVQIPPYYDNTKQFPPTVYSLLNAIFNAPSRIFYDKGLENSYKDGVDNSIFSLTWDRGADVQTWENGVWYSDTFTTVYDAIKTQVVDKHDVFFDIYGNYNKRYIAVRNLSDPSREVDDVLTIKRGIDSVDVTVDSSECYEYGIALGTAQTAGNHDCERLKTIPFEDIPQLDSQYIDENGIRQYETRRKFALVRNPLAGTEFGKHIIPNSTKTYVYDEEDTVTNLENRCKAQMRAETISSVSMSINASDLTMKKPLKIGYIYNVYIPVLGAKVKAILVKETVDLINPNLKKYEFGNYSPRITSQKKVKTTSRISSDGKTQSGVKSSDSNGEVSVTFPKKFDSVPRVSLSVNSDGYYGMYVANVKSVTRNGFTANVVYITENATYRQIATVQWTATQL